MTHAEDISQAIKYISLGKPSDADPTGEGGRGVTMQRGTCFINYEDFKECFKTYKEDTKATYSIQSSVSVRHHNSKCGTDIRQDIIFTQVKFCCSKLQGHNGKRDTQENICPAYFFLQYDMQLDRLVVKEECSTHIHSAATKSLLSSQVLPHVKPISNNSDVPSKKICGERLSPSPDKKDDQGNFKPDSPSMSQTDLPLIVQDKAEGHSSDMPSATIDTVLEGISGDAVSRLANLIKDFQTRDAGSKSLLSINCQQQLEQVCFQTSKMSSLFVRFPESLLLHKIASKHGYILYAFLVESKERVGKVVNFCFVREDDAKNISKMLVMFKDFNPEWPKVKVIYIDISFAHTDILKEAFPSAKALLSVYHTVRLIERKIRGSSDIKDWLHKWIDDAIYQTSPEKLSFLAEKLQHKLDKELYAKLCTNWFSCELLWYMHVKKGLHACSIYMDSLGLVIDTISSLLARQSSMEITIKQFVESADCFNSKGLANKRDGSVGFSRHIPKVSRKPNRSKPRPILPLQSSTSLVAQTGPFRTVKTKGVKVPPLDGSMNNQILETSDNRSPSGNDSALNPNISGKPQKIVDTLLHSLREHCSDLAFQLCSKEWEVVQKSTYLINVQTNSIAVQILEESHEVSLAGQYCTCYFNKLYKLPCRHILSMLCAHRKPVEEHMVCLSWQKKYIKPISDTKVCDTVLYYSKSEDEAMARVSMIKSLTKELCNLLMQCEGDSEMQVRFSTLQMIMDMWRKESSSDKDCLAQKQTNELPYQWVKKEPLEGEENSGCYELHRLDPHPAMN
ncbi:zinc finger SWIM domain-containing protein 3 [Mixophyes fleayi]|uniref:zinc finger SWIM domain-containing protein 3 n=1 Tax=Mixophyes fleayi TaxID=3061075 RepID=UPI003F4E1DB9